MSKVLIKRGLEANLPILSVGEFALTTDTLALFIGTGSGNIQLSARSGVSTKLFEEHGTFASASSTIAVELPIFKEGDSVQLYIGGIFQTRNIDYTVSGSTITKVDDPAKGGPTWPIGYTFDVQIYKNITDVDPDEPYIDCGTF